MANLNLSYPKKLDVALPANLRCGYGDDVDLATMAKRSGAGAAGAGAAGN